jgi:hypothetical protein
LVSNQRLAGRLIHTAIQILMLDFLPRWDLMHGSLPESLTMRSTSGSKIKRWISYGDQHPSILGLPSRSSPQWWGIVMTLSNSSIGIICMVDSILLSLMRKIKASTLKIFQLNLDHMSCRWLKSNEETTWWFHSVVTLHINKVN